MPPNASCFPHHCSTGTVSGGTLLGNAGAHLQLGNGGTQLGKNLQGTLTLAHQTGELTLGDGPAAGSKATIVVLRAAETITFDGNGTFRGTTLVPPTDISIVPVLVSRSAGLGMLQPSTRPPTAAISPDSGSLALSQAAFHAVDLTITADGGLAGAGTVTGAIINSGTTESLGGTLALLGKLTGSGSPAVGGASTLWLQAGAASSQTAQFLSTTGTLELSSPANFLGTMADTAATALTYANGTLTASEGSNAVAHLQISGTYTAGSLARGSDGHGSTATPTADAGRSQPGTAPAKLQDIKVFLLLFLQKKKNLSPL